MSKTVLFLDFDGVLHPVGGASAGTRLSQLPLLAAALREPALQHVQIVIASTWRQAHSIERLRRLFPADIAARIIGGTPVLDEYDSEHERYEEIRAWLDEQSEGWQWVALDDDREGFPDRVHKNVVFPDPAIGVTEVDLARIRGLLGG